LFKHLGHVFILIEAIMARYVNLTIFYFTWTSNHFTSKLLLSLIVLIFCIESAGGAKQKLLFFISHIADDTECFQWAYKKLYYGV
jgi:hypothetical protein